MKKAMSLAAAATAALIIALGASGQADAQSGGKKKKAATPPPAVTAPLAPAPLPAGPLEEPLSVAVEAYAAFQGDVTALETSPVNVVGDLDALLKRASGQNVDALTRGLIAYGAMTAAQSPEFAKSVRETAAFYGKDKFLFGAVIDPTYMGSMKGYNEALQLALEATRADGRRVEAVGERYKNLGTSLQKTKWGGQVAPQQAARLTGLKAAANGAFSRRAPTELKPYLTVSTVSLQPAADPTGFGGLRFWETITNPVLRTNLGSTITTASAPMAPPNPMMSGYKLRPHPDRQGAFNNMTTLAAVYILDMTREPAAQTEKLLNDAGTRNCLALKQAQFYQCVSAARFHYENAFCLGEHAIKDLGSCIAGATTLEAVAMSMPVIAPPPPPAPTPPAPAPAPKKKKKG